MTQTRNCPKCGAELPAGARAAAHLAPCPACLMKLGLESWSRGGKTIDSPAGVRGRFTPPKPHELAAFFPHLEILDLLGAGGMGAVYKARQLNLDRLVALKIVNPEAAGDPGFAERFAREARALARLNHQNIVAVHELGEAPAAGAPFGADRLYYFVMEYVAGANLRRLLESKQLTPQKSLAVISQICDALQYAHDAGVIHRDVKPENILIDPQGRAKIVDFGLAKMLASQDADFSLTGTRQVMGTPRYMAPEQFAGAREVDRRADIYSLGVVFYEMLTGELPLGRFDPPSHSQSVDAAPLGSAIDSIVMRALEKEPSRRFQNASDVKVEIERYTHSQGDAGASDSSVLVRSAASGRNAAMKAPIEPSDSSRTRPHVGLIAFAVATFLLGAATATLGFRSGAETFLWVGIGQFFVGGGLLAAAWKEEYRLEETNRLDPQRMAIGAAILLIAAVFFAYGVYRGPIAVSNQFLWMGIGMTYAGGGCCCSAWRNGGSRAG